MRILATATILFTLSATAQDIIGFLDRRDRMVAFDRGGFTELEARKPMAFKNGGNSVACVTQGEVLYVWRDGFRDTLDRTTAAITVTDHFLGFVDGGRLKVYDGGALRTLCTRTNGAVVEDSVVAWYDEEARTLNAFEGERTHVLESEGAAEAFKRLRSGDDVLAWTDAVGSLKAFFQGAVHVLTGPGAGAGFRCGAGVVAFEDPADHRFKAFGLAGVRVIDEVMPVRFVVGSGIVAYVDRGGSLKAWSRGAGTVLRGTPPDDFFVQDAMVVIIDRAGLSVFQAGAEHAIAAPAPARWVASRGSVAWQDDGGAVWLWREGAKGKIADMPALLDLRMERGTPVLEDDRATSIFWNDRMYTY